jgi:hypothetical protein
MGRCDLARRSFLLFGALLLLAMPALRPGTSVGDSSPSRVGADAVGGAPFAEGAVLDVGRSISPDLARAAERTRSLPGAAGLAVLAALLATAAAWISRSRRSVLGVALAGLARVVGSRAPPSVG